MNAFNVAGVPKNYSGFRDSILELINAITVEAEQGPVFSAITEIESLDQFDIPSASLQIDTNRIHESEYFVLVLVREVVSKSVLIEIGMAIAFGKKCLIFAQAGSEIPYVLRNAGAMANIKLFPFETINELIKKVRRNGKYMFKFSS